MKTNLLFALSLFCAAGCINAQSYSPILTTGYTLDAVAENTTALNTTTGGLDLGGNVLYSNAYGLLYGGAATGLPNNGLITNGSRVYQLQSYTAPNVLYVLPNMSDSILFTNPAPYPSLSMLAFTSEGNGTMNLKVRFTDGTTQLFSAVALADWFTGTNTVVTGFDRCNRNTGTPNYAAPTNPRMYYVDLNLTCANSQKNVQKIVVINTSTNSHISVMAVSGASAPTFSANTSPVTCAGGNNGTASVTVTNGVAPFTFTWPGQAAQSSTVGTSLPTGIVNYTITDASTCTFVSTVSIGQAIVPNTAITITASAMQVCSGSSVQLITSGASSYTWSNNGSTSSATVMPVTNTLYSVVATTSDNCTVSGSITINTIDLPVTSFSIPAYLCIDAAAIPLTASPAGGFFSGGSIVFNSFYASQAGAGTHTLSYTYTDAGGCTSVNTITTTVSTPTTTILFAITPSSICVGAAAITLTAQPAGGTYTGSGVTSGGVFNPSLAGIGTRTVSYIYTDANNCTVKKVSSINVAYCSSVGIQELSRYGGVEIYPNPNNGTFVIKTEMEFMLTVVNQLGQLVTKVKAESGTHEVVIKHLNAGVYFLLSDDGLFKRKIVVTE